MALEELKRLIPEFARDQKRNLDALLNSSTLSEQQRWGCILAAAMTANHHLVLGPARKEAQANLEARALEVVASCATVMTLNNYGFRAKHWLGEDFEDIRFGLRNGVKLAPGVGQADYELWAITVSAVNGCEQCIQAHSRDAQIAGVEKLQVWEAVKIAAVIQTIAQAIAMAQEIGDGLDG